MIYTVGARSIDGIAVLDPADCSAHSWRTRKSARSAAPGPSAVGAAPKGRRAAAAAAAHPRSACHHPHPCQDRHRAVIVCALPPRPGPRRWRRCAPSPGRCDHRLLRWAGRWVRRSPQPGPRPRCKPAWSITPIPRLCRYRAGERCGRGVALIAGQRDPQTLARLARCRMKVKHAASSAVLAHTNGFGFAGRPARPPLPAHTVPRL
jgi:hypothetical protein